MPHLYIPTVLEDSNEGGTFWTIACMAGSESKTETIKSVTCKDCKKIIEHPSTASQAAALLWLRVTQMQDADSEHNTFFAIRCNACPEELPADSWQYDQPHEVLARIVSVLEHCAFEHMGGAEATLCTYQTFLAAYEVNYATGKDPMNEYEARWRRNHDLPESVRR